MSSTLAVDVVLRPRLGAYYSARRQRVNIGSTQPVYFDVVDAQTRALVPGAGGASALYWMPGTLGTDAPGQPLAIAESSPGTLRVDVPSDVPGAWRVWLRIESPSAETADIVYDVPDDGGAPTLLTIEEWRSMQAAAAAAGASAAIPEANRVGAEAARPFAESAAASEIIALDAADMARDERIAAGEFAETAQTAAAALTDPSVAPNLVKNAAGTDVGDPFKFDKLVLPTAPATDLSGSARKAITVETLPILPLDIDTEFASPYLQRSTIQGERGDCVDMNARLLFRGRDAAGDAVWNNACWDSLIADANAYFASTGRRRTYKVNRRQIFQLSKTGLIIPPCRIDLNDSVLQYQGPATRSYVHVFAGEVELDSYNLYSRAGFIAYRAALFGRLTEAQGPLVHSVKIDADVQINNKAASGANKFDVAVTIGGPGTRIKSLHIKRQDFAFNCNAQATQLVGARIDDAVVELARAGLAWDNCKDIEIGRYRFDGASPNATPGPGENALLFEGVVQARVGPVFSRGSPEHAVRVGGVRSGTIPSSDIHCDDIITYQSGQTALKTWTANLATPLKRFSAKRVYAIDSGWFLSKQGSAPRYNDYGVNLQNIEDADIGQVFIGTEQATYSAYDGMQISGATRLTVGQATINSAARHSVFITPYCNQAVPQTGTAYGIDPAPNRGITLAGVVSNNPQGSALQVEEAAGYALECLEARLTASGGQRYVGWTGDGTIATKRVLIDYSGVDAAVPTYTGPSNAVIKVRDRSA
ncbi:hypothetical protein BKE38_05030 [Pseudoroseomonas deserti]|uniref:Uncharacterized protein n=1 Tax=Teichococcus deserti TaxID=1817963 RepID=A0A1V2H657_9PROT|nr:hypothetical protein [Pseudoroseomonas deserti]ONG56959.1 hypothetical protein BKE38_05030 [Pseudoroseomonas deserti]